MSVYPSELDFYGCANMTEADGVTIGGAVDFTKRIGFADLNSTGTVSVISSSASDTATKITYYGRDGTGTIQNETLTLNGQTAVAGSKSLARLLYAATSNAGSGGPVANPGGTTAAGDVALIQAASISAHTAQTGSANHTGVTPPLIKLQSGDGASVSIGQIIRTTGGAGPNQIRRIIAISGYGTDVVAVNADWGTIPDNTTTYNVHNGMLFEHANGAAQQTTAVIRHFATAAAAAAGGSTKYFYEKIFAVNGDTATSLTGASVLKLADPAGLYTAGGALDIALCTALNDTGTVANRQTAPGSGIGSFSSGAAPQTVSAANNLPSGSAPNSAGAQGVWVRLTLPAGASPANTSAQYEITGSTT